MFCKFWNAALIGRINIDNHFIFPCKIQRFLDTGVQIFHIFGSVFKQCQFPFHFLKNLFFDFFCSGGKNPAVFQLFCRNRFVDFPLQAVRFCLKLRFCLPFFGLFVFLEHFLQSFPVLFLEKSGFFCCTFY